MLDGFYVVHTALTAPPNDSDVNVHLLQVQ